MLSLLGYRQISVTIYKGRISYFTFQIYTILYMQTGLSTYSTFSIMMESLYLGRSSLEGRLRRVMTDQLRLALLLRTLSGLSSSQTYITFYTMIQTGLSPFPGSVCTPKLAISLSLGWISISTGISSISMMSPSMNSSAWMNSRMRVCVLRSSCFSCCQVTRIFQIWRWSERSKWKAIYQGRLGQIFMFLQGDGLVGVRGQEGGEDRSIMTSWGTIFQIIFQTITYFYTMTSFSTMTSFQMMTSFSMKTGFYTKMGFYTMISLQTTTSFSMNTSFSTIICFYTPTLTYTGTSTNTYSCLMTMTSFSITTGTYMISSLASRSLQCDSSQMQSSLWMKTELTRPTTKLSWFYPSPGPSRMHPSSSNFIITFQLFLCEPAQMYLTTSLSTITSFQTTTSLSTCLTTSFSMYTGTSTICLTILSRGQSMTLILGSYLSTEDQIQLCWKLLQLPNLKLLLFVSELASDCQQSALSSLIAKLFSSWKTSLMDRVCCGRYFYSGFCLMQMGTATQTRISFQMQTGTYLMMVLGGACELWRVIRASHREIVDCS